MYYSRNPGKSVVLYRMYACLYVGEQMHKLTYEELLEQNKLLKEELDAQVAMFKDYRDNQVELFKKLTIPIETYHLPLRAENLRLRAQIERLKTELQKDKYINDETKCSHCGEASLKSNLNLYYIPEEDRSIWLCSADYDLATKVY